MKTSLLSTEPQANVRIRQRRAGFTLIELLVVVSIIATLAGLTIMGVASAQKKAKSSDTMTRIKVIEDCLEQYKNTNGEYPTPANEGLTGEFYGQSFNIGGAACIYQAITADGNDQIRGYKPRANESPGASNGEFGSTKGDIFLKEANIQPTQWFQNSAGTYVITDAFRQPFQYRPNTPGADASTINNTTSFDLWSYGTLKAPSDESDHDAARQWIKNW